MSQDLKLALIIEARNNAKKAMEELNHLLGETKGGFREAGKGAEGLAAGSAKAEGGVKTLAAGLKTLYGYLAARTLWNFAEGLFQAGLRSERLERAFVAIEGSARSAQETLLFLRQESDRLGLSYLENAEAAKKFFAAAEGTALEQDARKIFSSVMEASTALGLAGSETSGILLALSQMISKGTVYAEELRLQLGERLPGAFRLAADAMGVTTAELDKMLQKGEITAEDLLPKLADTLRTKYTPELNGAQQAVGRLSTQWDLFKTNLSNMDAAIASINAVKEALKALNEALNPTYAEMKSDEIDRRIEKYRKALKSADLDPDLRAFWTEDLGRLEAQKAARNESPTDSWLVHQGERDAADQRAISILEQEKRALTEAADAAEKASKKKITLPAYMLAGYEAENRGDMISGKAAADKRGESMLADQLKQDLQLITEFADKHRAVVLGETDYKLEQLQIQAEAYREAGAEELAVEQWLAQERLNLAPDWQSGALRSLRAYADEAGDQAKTVGAAFSNSFQTMEDSLVGFIRTGKFEFKDFVDSILDELARVASKQVSSSLAGMVLKAFTGVFTSSLGGGAAAGAEQLSNGAIVNPSGVVWRMHEGGIVGRDGSNPSMVSLSVFRNAKRYHSGGMIGGDEVPIIAKRGEGVFTEQQMKGMGGVTNYFTIDARGADPSVELRIESAVERATEQAYQKVLRDKRRGGPVWRDR